MKLSVSEYEELDNSNVGYCTNCKSITDDCYHEPDASKYPCEHCGENKSYGIQECLIMGLIDIIE